jgi:hypothetical protein
MNCGFSPRIVSCIPSWTDVSRETVFFMKKMALLRFNWFLWGVLLMEYVVWSCTELNYCNGHGKCLSQSNTCECFDG